MGGAKRKRALAVLLGVVLVASQSGAVAFGGVGKGFASEKAAALVGDASFGGARMLSGALAVDVPYLDDNGIGQTCASATLVDGSASWSGVDEEAWYVVPAGEFSIGERIQVSGTVHLILADGAKLFANEGINVAAGTSLTIYQQVGMTGSLTAAGHDTAAGIGGSFGEEGGSITINGGTVVATAESGAGIGGGAHGEGGFVTIGGGMVQASSVSGAGIGGGYFGGGGMFSMYGGKVKAFADMGAGIGGGGSEVDEFGIGGGNGGIVSINGGIIEASSHSGSGIGGGNHGAGGIVSINEGSVNALGGTSSSGIGGGLECGGGIVGINGGTVNAMGGSNASGIGGGENGIGGNVVVAGGVIKALGGDLASGIGGGYPSDQGGSFSTMPDSSAFIVSNDIQDKNSQAEWSGVIFDGPLGEVYGTPTLTQDAEIPAGFKLGIGNASSLTVDAGVTLTIGGTIVNNGSLANNGTIAVRGAIENNGAIANVGVIDSEGTIENGGTLVNDGVVNNSGTLSGNDLEGEPANVPSRVVVMFAIAGNPGPVTTASFGQTVTAIATIAQKTRAPLAGTVDFYVNDKEAGHFLGSASVVGTGASLDIPLSMAKGFVIGSNTIVAEFGGSPGLIASEAEAQLFVNFGQQTAGEVAVDQTEVVYGDAAPAVDPFAALDGAAVSYSIVSNTTGVDDASDVASINGDRRITVNKAGSFYVRADIEETDEYDAKTVYSALITVEKRRVSVRPADASIMRGEALPAFSLAYDGLVAGESIAPDVEPTFACEADGLVTGEFAIAWTNMDAVQFSGAENYEVSKAAQATLRVAEPASRMLPVPDGASGQTNGQESSQDPKVLANTGDPSAAAPWALLTLASAAALGAISTRRKRRMER